MPENIEEQKKPAMSKAEMVARLVGPSLKHDEEDIEFWRNASDELRGRTLYELLARGVLIRASVPNLLEEGEAERPLLKPVKQAKKT